MRSLHPAVLVLLAAAPAQADINSWFLQANLGTTPKYVALNPVSPSFIDIGLLTPTGGTTYEFIVSAQLTGPSSALMGTRMTSPGDAAALKYEQWFESAEYGVTEFGVADYTIAPVAGFIQHLVFVSDPANGVTTLYRDGALIGTAPYAPTLSGIVGLGQVDDPVNGVSDVLDGTIHGVAVYDSMLTPSEIGTHYFWWFFYQGVPGSATCPGLANSTGSPATLHAAGTEEAGVGDLGLFVTNAPANQFGLFLCSLTPGLSTNPGGSQGNLCLGGAIGRFREPGQVVSSGPQGIFVLDLDVPFPQPSGFTFPSIGQTWHFQAWYRDFNPALTSNFSNGYSISFN